MSYEVTTAHPYLFDDASLDAAQRSGGIWILRRDLIVRD